MDDVKKPLPVKIVEVIAWTYVALSLVGVLGAIVAECRGNGGALMSLFGILLDGSFPLALFFGMILSLRRGSRAWFVVPNTIVTLLCLFGSAVVLCESISAVALFLGLVALLLFVGPLVLLYMPTSTRWFKAKAKDGRPDSLGCLGVFLLALLFVVGGSIFPSIICYSRVGRINVQSQMMAMCGRNLYAFMMQDNQEHESGGDWIDPASFSNSTQFVQALWAKLGEDKAPCPYPDSWCIAVNPPDNDKFPVMVTANIDPRELLCSQDKDQPLKLTCPKEWGGTCFKVCEKAGVIVYKGGNTKIVKSKYARPNVIFPDGIPKPGPDTYFLTPTGRVDLVEGQKNAMSNSVNFKYLSVNESERGVVAEFLLENRTQRGMFVFGSDDALATYFLKDGAWVFCSMANDVESSNPAGEKGLFVEKGNSLRVSGRIPQECLRTKWFIVVGISMRNEDEMESVVASPVYSRGNELGEGLSFKGEMNSVFKGRLKAFIANE